MEAGFKFSEKDKKIIEVLKQNARLSTQKISKKVLIPITTVHNRIKRLEKEGIIKNYTINLDYKKLGKGVISFILITVTYFLPDKKLQQEEIAKNIKKIGAEEVYIIAGNEDILAKIRVKDIEELNDFVVKRLRNIEGVEKTRTMIVLSEV